MKECTYCNNEAITKIDVPVVLDIPKRRLKNNKMEHFIASTSKNMSVRLCSHHSENLPAHVKARLCN